MENRKMNPFRACAIGEVGMVEVLYILYLISYANLELKIYLINLNYKILITIRGDIRRCYYDHTFELDDSQS